MNMNKINNIVFYKSYDENGNPVKKVTVFYKGGNVENISYEKGIDICEEIAKEQGISSKNTFKEMINKNIVHVTTEKSFTENYNKYIDFGREAIKDAITEASQKIELEEQEKVDVKETVKAEETNFLNSSIKEEPKKKESLLSRINERIKKSKLGKKIAAIGLVGALMFGGYSCSQRKTKEGQMRIADQTTEVNNNKANTKKVKENKTTKKVINDSSIDQLIKETKNETQLEAMKNTYDALKKFNKDFANDHAQIVDGKEIKPALTFDEVMALQMAYNNYSADEIRAIFNGTEIDANTMKKDYKSASLQLMGAYVIETPENPVDMSMLINSQEGKDFYNKYHKMFLAIKSTSGEEQLTNIKNFQATIREDFPINDEERTEGISHRYSYDSVTEEKSAVLPMIAAYEIMYQNKVQDFTLNDIQIDFLNDAGFCNLIYDNFDKIENITMLMKEDKTNPTYKQYKKAVIYELQKIDAYPKADYNNELTKLDEFQNIVNANFNNNSHLEYNNNLEGYYYSTFGYSTESITNSWTEQHTEYHETEERIEKEIPENVKKEIDDKIEKENQKAKEEAEKEAEETAKQLQEEEDKKAEEIEKEIKEEEKDLEQKIEEANKQIDKNNDSDPKNDKPVNESDFGDHNVDFDSNHSDSQGNLDDSVENITTDPTGDQTGEELPDPNETGKEFDNNAPKVVEESTTTEEYTESYQEPVQTPEITNDNTNSYPQNETYDDIEIEYSNPTNELPLDTISSVNTDNNNVLINSYYEQIANYYVEQLANQSVSEENAYVYKI